MSKMTDEQRREVERLAELPDEVIDTSEIPEFADLPGAIRGRFYRPVKKQIMLSVDAELLEWFRAQGGSIRHA